MVAYLHGSGERGNNPNVLIDLGRLLSAPNSETLPAIVLVPQCQIQRFWEPLDIADFVEAACRRYAIDRGRVYLLGFSMGGDGCWAAAAAYPDLFAAIVPIAGRYNTENAPTLAKIPIWAFHGAKDEVVSVERTTLLVDNIRTAGGNSRLTVFPDTGHGIDRKVCEGEELWKWLFKQRLLDRLARHEDESVPTIETQDQ